MSEKVEVTQIDGNTANNALVNLHRTFFKKQNDESSKIYFETELAAQEWGIKNDLRLFGITVAEWCEPGENDFKPMAKAFFIDHGYKTITILYLNIKETGGKVLVSRAKGSFQATTKWPIRIARTKNFNTGRIDPVCPLYFVLVDRGIILPFRSQMKNKEWAAMPFEDMDNIKKIKT